MFNTPCTFTDFSYDNQFKMNTTSSLITSKHTEHQATYT